MKSYFFEVQDKIILTIRHKDDNLVSRIPIKIIGIELIGIALLGIIFLFG